MTYDTDFSQSVAKAIAGIEYGDGHNDPWEPFEAHADAAIQCVMDCLVADNVTFDIALEEALQSEGIWAWGPDGEKFERMLRAFVSAAKAMSARQSQDRHGLGPQDASAAPTGVCPEASTERTKQGDASHG